jgi:hypothetical protein
MLLARGARHHIFSAMAMRDRDLVQTLVEQDPGCLLRRRSRFENMQTPVHAAFAPPDGLGFLGGQPDDAMLVTRLSPMLSVVDMRATVRWYRAMGSTVADEYEDSGELLFARVVLGKSSIHARTGRKPVTAERQAVVLHRSRRSTL